MIDEEFRTEYAIYKGEYIHISSIYDVIGGKQINKEKELDDLRVKARNNDLFCPCGCKSNVTVVAGEKMKRKQHFRLLHSNNNKNCIGVTEGTVSIQSRIVLDKWLKDKLHTNEIESRVPICSVSDTKRKYEFSFLCESKKVAVNYCHLQSNISDEKLSILDENKNGKSIIHIVDYKNGSFAGQFPEHLKKIQNKQDFCLLLSIEGAEYHKARLTAVFYDRDLDGYWKEIPFADGLLSDYDINEYGLIYNSVSLTDLLNTEKTKFARKQEEEQKRRDEYAKASAERLRKQQEEYKKRQEELQKRQKESLHNPQNQEKPPYDYKSYIKKTYEEIFPSYKPIIEEPHQEEPITNKFTDAEVRYNKWKNFSVEDALNSPDTPAIDPDGNRWVRCEFCGYKGKENNFVTFGGTGRVNLGRCKKCRKVPGTPAKTNNSELIHPQLDPNKCNNPACNGTWVLRTNRLNGEKFWGCSNFKFGCKETKPYRSEI